MNPSCNGQPPEMSGADSWTESDGTATPTASSPAPSSACTSPGRSFALRINLAHCKYPVCECGIPS